MGRELLERARAEGGRVGRLEQLQQGELESCSGVGVKQGRPMEVPSVSGSLLVRSARYLRRYCCIS